MPERGISTRPPTCENLREINVDTLVQPQINEAAINVIV